MSDVTDRAFLSIGEVLELLKEEFPDITISKIRFLEGEGLIEPERTASGYRKFYEQDVERLRHILRMQRDEYLPLKVIKDRLVRESEDAQPARAEQDAPDGLRHRDPRGALLSFFEHGRGLECIPTKPDPAVVDLLRGQRSCLGVLSPVLLERVRPWPRLAGDRVRFISRVLGASLRR